MKEAFLGINSALDAFNNSNRTLVFYGEIKKVDSHNQTITVMSPVAGRPITVPINNAVSYNGEGIRYMPSTDSMLALIMKDGAPPQYYHIGYFFKDARSLTDNKLTTSNSGKLSQRFLEQGEVQLVGKSLSEVYLASNGSIFIKSGNGQYLNLNDTDMFLDGYFGTMNFELENVRIRAGNVRRSIDLLDTTSEEDKEASTHEDEYIIEDDAYIPEFSISVGVSHDSDGVDLATYDDYTGIANYPYVGFLSIGEKVFDNQGNEEKVLDKTLKLLAKFPGGVSLAVDEEGSFIILDQANDNFIRFKTGIDSEDETIPLTEFEIKLNAADIKINNNVISILDNKNNSILLDENGIVAQDFTGNKVTMNDAEVVVHSENDLKLVSNGGGGEEKSILGETLKDLLQDFLTKVSTHTHVGPVGPPSNAADFVTIASVDLPETLSDKTKNN